MSSLNVLIKSWVDKLSKDTTLGKLTWVQGSPQKQHLIATLPNFYIVEVLLDSPMCEFCIRKRALHLETLISETFRVGHDRYDEIEKLYLLADKSARKLLPYARLAIYNEVNQAIMGED